MGFLRRWLGGSADTDRAVGTDDAGGEGDGQAPPDLDADERARELELARFDQERLDDLVRRQQRFADRSWVPPVQGGPKRADDGEAGRD